MEHFKLLRSNRSLSFLWLGTLLSSLGDWFRHVSVLVMVIKLTGIGIEMGILLTLEIIPLLLVGPFGGVVIDKFNIKRLMICSDLIRAILTLGFLTINSSDKIGFVYFLIASISVIDQFYVTSRQVLISRIVPKNKLIAVNALFTFTSGFCLAGGSILAAYITLKYGYAIAFFFDSSSFAISALLITGIKYCCQIPLVRSYISNKIGKQYYMDLKDALFYLLKNNPTVYLLMLFNLVRLFGYGFVYLLLGVFGSKVFQIGDSGISIFYSSFGTGIFIGGILAKKLAEKSFAMNHFLLVGLAILSEGIFVLIFSQITTFIFSLTILTIAFILRGISITFYNSLMMHLVRDNFRGRIFMADRIFSYTIMSSAIMIGSLGLSVLSPQELALVSGGILFLNGALWLILVSKRGLSTMILHLPKDNSWTS